MIEIDAYSDFDTLTRKLETLARSTIIELSSIGTTPEGRELWCAKACDDTAPVPSDERPGVLVTANMHAREFAGSWTALHLLDRFVDAFGRDPRITELLGTHIFYVIPRVCPDGAEFVLDTRTRQCRSRFVEIDESEVRRPNVILPEDVSGDGRILSMRWPAPDGDHVVPEDEPRLTLSRPDDATEETFYHHTVEGRVANYDGGTPSAVNMRSDFNRNFPSTTWEPQHWIGHGRYPLSEPETRALADFILAHPNISIVADLHCGNPAIFYPQGVRSGDVEYPADASLFRRIGARGEELTGFPYLEGYYEASGGDPYTLHGAFKDWVYERVGIPAYTVEHGMLYNSLGFGTDDLAMDGREHARETGEALLEYHDDHPDRSVFFDWEPVEHPQLGEVEIGGWDWAHWSCPAIEDMPEIAENVTDWIIELAEWTPAIDIESSVHHVDGALYRVNATVRNVGRVPTYVTERGRDSIQDEEPVVTIDCPDLVAGRSRQTIGHLDGHGDGERFEWVVRGDGDVTISVDGGRGANASSKITITR